jgi:hypothetical protein
MSGGVIEKDLSAQPTATAQQEEPRSYKTMAFKVDEELQKAMRLHCLKNGKVMAVVINNLMRDYLSEHDKD